MPEKLSLLPPELAGFNNDLTGGGSKRPGVWNLAASATLWKERRALGDFLYFSAPQHVLLRFVVWGNLLDGLANTRFTPKSLCFPDMFPVISFLSLLFLFRSELPSSRLSHAQVSSFRPRCPLLSLPRTPLVTSLRRLSVQFPPAARGQVSHRRFRLWSALN
ncbi:hypothetical protein PGT21_013499 [Puccinia graminis f. sp. tritici]|uniref:Uncharacterized protein n=1 Tax=Puccinia graminis f. sp. tritici TaxID=56615 RepID=A0A5B0LP70_PUCGR|nr:hypothetical protein PGT21_013499 [Puccinia graminis f. sp. tritici]